MHVPAVVLVVEDAPSGTTQIQCWSGTVKSHPGPFTLSQKPRCLICVTVKLVTRSHRSSDAPGAQLPDGYGLFVILSHLWLQVESRRHGAPSMFSPEAICSVGSRLHFIPDVQTANVSAGTLNSRVISKRAIFEGFLDFVIEWFFITFEVGVLVYGEFSATLAMLAERV